ncbi:sialidase family protein [Luteipulveratus sp. YIM 133132]|uniref:WD40/YVTN/BNR-like repeat-containing protein n=1 Tax=Luteipulveratus flavus TaxID=3031728 RepID=UPI0023B0C7A3|nr:sialidase family protein [Luteipulveratus sp. YIM 133132]MDE9366794.1 sialidase family protein [Luteipulveratus sp. YIM 133132]
MNPNVSGDPEDQDDPVARFFAQERDAVRSAPVDDDEWQHIVALSGTRVTRRPWWGVVAGAAAAVAIGVAGWSVHQKSFGEGEVSRGAAVSASTSPTIESFDRAGAPAAAAAQATSPVDPRFTTWSLTYAGQGAMFAFGSSPCRPAGTCPTLLRSIDNGGTWVTVHTFPQADMSRASGGQQPYVQGEKALTEARFALPEVGYVLGGDLWVTGDAGASFTRVEHPGRTVLDVEIEGLGDRRAKVVVLSADGCSAQGCTGPMYVSTATSDGPRALRRVATQQAAGRIADAQLVLRNGQVYVQPTGGGTGPVRLDGGSLTSLSATACGGRPLEALTSSADAKNVLYAACEAGSSGGSVRYRVLRSTDDGSTWQVSGDQLVMPRAGRLSLASTRDGRIVATTGGPRQPRGPVSATHLQVTTDGGRTWSRPAVPAAPTDGFDWSASPGGSQVYAVSRITRGFWYSGNDGRSWRVVDPYRSASAPSRR